MASHQVTITMTPELGRALDDLARRLVMDRSRLLETLLREHPDVQGAIRIERAAPSFKKERTREDLMALARSAQREWARQVASGKVEYRGKP